LGPESGADCHVAALRRSCHRDALSFDVGRPVRDTCTVVRSSGQVVGNSPLDTTLDRRTRLPLYVQIAAHVRELIEHERLGPGAALPSEADLRERLRVSRATIRQALHELELEGWIERHQGRGTFVALPPLERSLPELTSFSEHLASKGLASSSRLLRHDRLSAGGRETGAPGGPLPSPDSPDPKLFPVGTALVRVVRLRLANTAAVGIHTTLLPQRLADEIGFTEERLRADEQCSLYACFERQGRRLRFAEEHLRARTASAAEARLLGVARKTPVMSVLRLTRDESGELVEAARAVYLGDKYDYVITLDRAGTQRR
jgi:GntR family transcriptional regulator